MAVDVIRFYEDNNVQYKTDGHKHCRAGWVNIECPFCTGNPGYHLGYCFSKEDAFYGSYVCYRCGRHSVFSVFKNFMDSASNSEIMRAMHDYSDGESEPVKRFKEKSCEDKIVHLPVGCGPIKRDHIDYLKSRKYNYKNIVRTWDIMGTGFIGDYKWRIVAPIYQGGRLVSYQGRDITKKSSMRYKPCLKKLEVKHHKECLYGLDLVPGNRILVVEGITDAWRMGPGAVATFGIKFTLSQVMLLSEFAKVFLMFDLGKTEYDQMEKMASYLSVFTDVSILKLKKGDPGDLSDDEAQRIMVNVVL
jgi:hypothetical protein